MAKIKEMTELYDLIPSFLLSFQPPLQGVWKHNYGFMAFMVLVPLRGNRQCNDFMAFMVLLAIILVSVPLRGKR